MKNIVTRIQNNYELICWLTYRKYCKVQEKRATIQISQIRIIRLPISCEIMVSKTQNNNLYFISHTYVLSVLH